MSGATDIVARLRNWRAVHLARLHLLMEEAADEIDRLRADWPEQLSAARSEIERLRLTDEEREAVEAAARIVDEYDDEMDGFPSGAAATLRRLLERLG